ncbi:MAG: DUF2064 domain-containing protein, partial [Chitinophagales bacterium]
MVSEEKKTVIILFSRTREDEAAAKDFSNINSYQTNLRIAETLISRTGKIIKESGLPCFIIDSNQQEGKSFGEKISNAFRSIFLLGVENVIAIGNDCPSLTKSDLLKAAKDLQHVNAVAGPAKDGGLYLIGLNKNFFDSELFQQLSWGSDKVADDFIEYLHKMTASFMISTVKDDVDNFESLVKVIKNKSIAISIIAKLN